jgi:hypothetical protein
MLPLVLFALPADAASTGSNAGTVTVAPEAVRSLTVTPASSTFANCSGGNATEMSIPNGSCSVGVPSGQVIAGGVTITNGSVAGHIDVIGQSAVPASGTAWALVNANGPAPGQDQFAETLGGGGPLFGGGTVTTTASCDTAFTGGSCQTATAGATQEEAINIFGPSASTSPGPFTVTTTWTAVS